MQISDSVFCVDPSCFTSLQKLKDTVDFLFEIRTENKEMEVYVPSEVFKVINLQPEEKFRALAPLIGDWIDIDEHDNIVLMDDETKQKYVSKMRDFFGLFKMLPISSSIGEIDKIGSESLFRNNLKEQFGKHCGNILFEMAAISEKSFAKILSFGEKTISFFRRIGSRVEKGASELKKQIKSKAKIRTPVNIMMYYFAPTPAVIAFIQEFQIQGMHALLDPRFAAIALPLGWFIVANS
jgi:hypothetical protein